MYNYEWNSHLMGHHFWTSLQLSALLLCFFYPFHFLLVPVILHVFSHYHCIFYHHLKSHVFPQAVFLMPRSTVWCPKDRKRFWPKRRPENHHHNCRHDFHDVGIFLPQVTSNIVALAFSVQHFLAVGTLEKKVLGKEKTCEKRRFIVQWTLRILEIVLDHQSSNWFKKALHNVKSMPITGAKCETDLQITIASIFFRNMAIYDDRNHHSFPNHHMISGTT